MNYKLRKPGSRLYWKQRGNRGTANNFELPERAKTSPILEILSNNSAPRVPSRRASYRLSIISPLLDDEVYKPYRTVFFFTYFFAESASLDETERSNESGQLFSMLMANLPSDVSSSYCCIHYILHWRGNNVRSSGNNEISFHERELCVSGDDDGT